MAIRSYVETGAASCEVIVLKLRSHTGSEIPSSIDDCSISVRKALAGALRSEIRNRGADVVHCHSTVAGWLVRSVRVDVPVVFTPHCFSFQRLDLGPSRRRALRNIEHGLTRRTAAFAACSASEAVLCRSVAPEAIIVHVPHAVHVEPEWSTWTPPRVGNPVVAMCGRLGRQKDPGFFADVVARIRREVRVRAVWIGDGDMRSRGLLEDRGIEVSGWLEDPNPVLATATVYCHTAAWEGEALAPLEAAALGIPVVMRRESDVHSVSYARMAADPVECADECIRLLRDQDAMERQRRLAFQALAARYSVRCQRDALLDVYNRALTTQGQHK